MSHIFKKRTQHFSEKLSKTTPSDKYLLITLDVERLYTNILDNMDGIKSVEKAFKNNPNEKRPAYQILKLV